MAFGVSQFWISRFARQVIGWKNKPINGMVVPSMTQNMCGPLQEPCQKAGYKTRRVTVEGIGTETPFIPSLELDHVIIFFSMAGNFHAAA